MGKITPDFTFLMTVAIKNLNKRLLKRKKLNRYDKFKRSFYIKVQKGFLKISLKKKKKYMIIDSNNEINRNKNIIFSKFKKLVN